MCSTLYSMYTFAVCNQSPVSAICVSGRRMGTAKGSIRLQQYSHKIFLNTPKHFAPLVTAYFCNLSGSILLQHQWPHTFATLVAAYFNNTCGSIPLQHQLRHTFATHKWGHPFATLVAAYFCNTGGGIPLRQQLRHTFATHQ